MAWLVKRKRLVAVLIVLGLCGYGMQRLMAGNGRPQKPKLVKVKRKDLIAKVTETGVVQPVTKVEIKSKVGGKIIKLPIEEGQEVKAGDLIAQLDVDELLPQVQQVEAQLRSADARVEGARVAVDYQRVQTSSGLEQDDATLKTAIARRNQSQVELGMQRKVADASLREAISGQAAAKAQLDQLLAGSRPQEVQQAEQAVASARARCVEAEKDLNRKRALEKKGYLPQAQVDSAEATMSVVQADLESAQKRLSMVKEGPRKEEIAAAQAALRQRDAGVETAQANLDQVRVSQEALSQAVLSIAHARAGLAATRNGRRQETIRKTDLAQAVAEAARLRSQLAELRARLSYATVRTPVSGTVIRRDIEPGELITSGVSSFNNGMTICTVAELRHMEVRALVNEVDVARVKVGHSVEVKVDSVPNRTFHGTVTSVSPGSSTQSQTQTGADAGVVKFLVKIAVENPERLLRPGMTASCGILVGKRKSVFTLPLDALRERGADGLVDVYVGGKVPPADPKKAFKEQVVHMGLKTATDVEVLGLKEGTEVRADKRTYTDRKKIDVSRGPDR
ncbi:MAG TPA: efflux RND transporter periplasmic adaptor subunit [Armatimonadota bacterium]|jgi:multidrug efflux pump subunit AcrA (membrane-fusion protein)